MCVAAAEDDDDLEVDDDLMVSTLQNLMPLASGSEFFNLCVKLLQHVAAG
jgi:hypothetical protein